jgi:dTDP-4-dehydrorhamnose 3,5-epimerase
VRVAPTALEGLLLLEPDVHRDARGCFFELWSDSRYAAAGLRRAFAQDNCSSSTRGVLRGLHAQSPRAQAKLVTCLAGEIWDVAVDARPSSSTFGRWDAYVLSAANRRQLYLPEGFLHGFVVLSAEACVHYKASDVYDPATELSIVWDDPDLGIRWPIDAPKLSAKDARAPRLRDVPRARLDGAVA